MPLHLHEPLSKQGNIQHLMIEIFLCTFSYRPVSRGLIMNEILMQKNTAYTTNPRDLDSWLPNSII